MAKIRHEINMIANACGGGYDGAEKTQITPSSYNGTLTWYFEVYIQATTSTVYLHDSAHNIHATATGLGLVRVQCSTDPTEDTYHINVVGDLCMIARVICIQDTGTDPIIASESQFEIGVAFSTATTTLTPITYPKYWKYNSANWNGTVTAYFEAAMTGNTTGKVYTAQLQSSTNFSTWTDVTNGTVTITPSVSNQVALVRSSAITLTNGCYYRVAIKSASTMYTVHLYSAKIIVKQSGFIAISNEVLSSSISNSVSYINFTFKNPVILNNATTYYLVVERTGVRDTTNRYEVSSTSGSIDDAYTDGTLFTRNNGLWTEPTYPENLVLRLKTDSTILLDINYTTKVVCNIYGETGTAEKRGQSFLPTSTWSLNNIDLYIRKAGSPTDSVVIKIYSGSIEGTLLSNTITKLEEQYLLRNTTDSGIGLQNKPTKWDSTEWSGVTNAYYYAHDSDNVSNSSKLVDITANPDMDIISATGINQITSSIPSSISLSYDNYASDESSYFGIYGGTGTSSEVGQSWGQSFTTTSTYSIDAIQLVVLPLGTPTDGIFVKLYSGSIGGTLLGISNTVTSESMLGSFVPFTFNSPIQLTNATKYFFVIERTGSRDGSNTFYVYGDYLGYSGGGIFKKDNNVWGSESASGDMSFKLTGSHTVFSTSINLDTYVTNSTGIMGASRIIVFVTVSTTQTITGSTTLTGSSTLSPSAMLYVLDATNLTGSADLTAIGTIILPSKPLYFNVDGLIKSSTLAQANIDGTIVNLTKAQANVDGVIKTIWVSTYTPSQLMATWDVYNINAVLIESESINTSQFEQYTKELTYFNTVTPLENGNVWVSNISGDYADSIMLNDYFSLNVMGNVPTELSSVNKCVAVSDADSLITIQWVVVTSSLGMGTFIQTVIASDGAYPDDGIQDGYWYKRK